MPISADQLARFAPNCDAATIAPLLDAQATRCEINTPLRIAHWLGQMFVESAGFTRLVENLNYSAEGLLATFPAHFDAATIGNYARQPEKIANRAYANRMGNRDEASGDGWRFRGRGFMQRTGHNGYVQAAANTGLDLVNNPDQLAQPDAAATDAADYWRVNNINALADNDDLNGCTRAVNGGLTDLQARSDAVDNAATIWGA